MTERGSGSGGPAGPGRELAKVDLDAPGREAGGVPIPGAGDLADGATGGSDGILVIGYGNALRSDDGVGWHAAALLADDPRLRAAGAEVLARHQLTPELAADMATAALVILVDASVDLEPGEIAVRRLGGPAAGNAEDPRIDRGVASHHVGARELLTLARDLYHAAPEAWEVAVGVESMETGEDLSPAVAAALPAVADAVADLAGRGRERAQRAAPGRGG